MTALSDSQASNTVKCRVTRANQPKHKPAGFGNDRATRFRTRWSPVWFGLVDVVGLGANREKGWTGAHGGSEADEGDQHGQVGARGAVGFRPSELRGPRRAHLRRRGVDDGVGPTVARDKEMRARVSASFIVALGESLTGFDGPWGLEENESVAVLVVEAGAGRLGLVQFAMNQFAVSLMRLLALALDFSVSSLFFSA